MSFMSFRPSEASGEIYSHTQIFPVRIQSFYQFILFTTIPFFKLFFTSNCCINIQRLFKIYYLNIITSVEKARIRKNIYIKEMYFEISGNEKSKRAQTIVSAPSEIEVNPLPFARNSFLLSELLSFNLSKNF